MALVVAPLAVLLTFPLGIFALPGLIDLPTGYITWYVLGRPDKPSGVDVMCHVH